MLKSLAVENFTIIEKAHLEFSAGMTTITGETGAGKSILIDALGLALGRRAQSHYLNADAKLSVTLEVEPVNLPDVVAWLEEHDLASGEECILRRTLARDGRSRAFINGVQVPIAQMQSLSARLIEIVGQNSQQPLMHPGGHLDILDAQCNHDDALEALRTVHREWSATSRKLKARLQQSSEIEDRVALLNYQLKELDEFAPEDGEFERVDQAHRRLSKKELLREEAHRALALLDQTESSDASAQIAAAARSLRALADADPGLATASEQLDAALDHVQTASREIRDCLERVEVSEEEYQALEKRLRGYLDLSHKYKTKPEALVEFRRGLRKTLDETESPEANPEAMQRRLDELKARYATLACKVGKRRRATAAALCKEVTNTLEDLNMQGAEFSVEFKPNDDDAPSAHGGEQAEFFVRTNAGQPSGPLARIASGGELSRVSLAIQAAFAAKNPVPTLVFDEVDAGVGGKTAELVGKLLKKISAGTQVFCVTHLPQVAAQADHHFRVDKQERDGHTRVDIAALSPEQRRGEIARMMAGAEITEKSLAHAGEMLNPRG